VRLRLARGSVYVRLKRYQESLQDRDEAVNLDPYNADAYVARGGSYHLLGEHEKGLADRTMATTINPNSPLAWSARGNAYLLMGRYDDAVADLKRAQALDPSDLETQKLVAQAQAKVNEIVQAAIEKEKAPETGTVTLPDTSTRLAQHEESKVASEPEAPPVTTPAPAAPPARQVVAPSNAITAAECHMAGRKLLQEQHWSEAIVQFDQALKLDPSLSLAYNARGYAHYRLKHFAEAMRDFDEAIRLNPNYANAYLNRSALRKTVGDKAGADADQVKAKEVLAK